MFGRLTMNKDQCVNALRNLREHTDITETFVYIAKGSDVPVSADMGFKTKCMEASRMCAKSSNCYMLAYNIMMSISTLLAMGCAFIALYSLLWGVITGVISALLTIIYSIFKFGPLGEKYATLSYKFINISKATSIAGRDSQFEEGKMLMESPILETDMH